MPAQTEYRVDGAELLAFTKAALEAAGVDDWSVEIVATSLVNASLRGTDSHGVASIHTHSNLLFLGLFF